MLKKLILLVIITLALTGCDGVKLYPEETDPGIEVCGPNGGLNYYIVSRCCIEYTCKNGAVWYKDRVRSGHRKGLVDNYKGWVIENVSTECT